MKKLALIAALISPLAAEASTVSLSNSPTGPAAFLADGTTLVANGSLVRVGLIGNLSDPINTFIEFGTSAIRNLGVGGGARPGKVGGSVTASGAESTHNTFNNQTIYLWIYNAPTAAAASQQGIFSTTRQFPVNDVAGVGDDTTVLVGTEVLGTVDIPGWFPAKIETGDAVNSKRFILATPIPEPASTSFAGIASLAFLARRRRS